MSPAASGSCATQLIEGGDVLKIHNVLIFDFYPVLPHLW